MSKMQLFAYGSLTEGMVHFGRIRDFIKSTRPASTKGAIYQLKVGFPAMVLEGADQIVGQLFELSGSELLIQLLDQFYGYNSQDPSKSVYHRESVFVQVGDSIESAFIYVLNPDKIPAGAVRIDGGDWQSSLRNSPPLTEKLSERQRSYIQRLGSSSGREIVPIDLGLYRELMSLELIVDKGRRLALSKLGQDLFRHLQ